MKKALVAAALLGLAVGNVAHAAQNQPYFGIKGGFMSLDGVGADDAINIGGVVGMKIQDLSPSSGLTGSISVEGELTLTVVEGDIGFFGFNGEWDVMTLAGYGVYRSAAPSNVYFKGKAGLVYEDVSIDIPTGFGTVNGSGTDIGLSLGVGVGFKVGQRNSIEVEYTLIESDIDFLSVGYNF